MPLLMIFSYVILELCISVEDRLSSKLSLLMKSFSIGLPSITYQHMTGQYEERKQSTKLPIKLS